MRMTATATYRRSPTSRWRGGRAGAWATTRDRLTSASSLLYPGGATYTYDVLDNVTRATVAGRDHVYWYDANNRLTNVLNGPGGASIIGLGYDARGNVNNKNGSLFVFDHGNRLRTAQGTDTYRYDAQGRRVRTAGADGLLYEVYSLDGKLLWQRDEPLGLRFQHIYLGGSLVASRRMPIGQTTFSTTYRHTDALGSPIAATDEIGAVLQTTEHEPYGKMLNRSNDNRPGYTGHMMDKATGLVYMQQRYYDPLIPRFLSVDPITAYSNPVGAFNRYWYANNNPYKFTDPDGRQAVPDKPLVFYQITMRTTTDRGAVNVTRTNVSNYGVVHGTRTEVRGTVTLLPQKSQGGTPANPGPAVTARLLNFSDKSGGNIEVTSGQRTVEQNRAVGGASRSQHLQDNAADIRISGNTPKQTADAAYSSGEFNRVNQYTDGRGVHVDLKQDGTQGRFTDWKPQK